MNTSINQQENVFALARTLHVSDVQSYLFYSYYYYYKRKVTYSQDELCKTGLLIAWTVFGPCCVKSLYKVVLHFLDVFNKRNNICYIKT